MADSQDPKDKNEKKEKKKLVLESSTIIMIVSLVFIFLVTIANKINLLPSWLTWTLLILFLAAMVLAMFFPKRKNQKV